MSHIVDGNADVYRETRRRARKQHWCCACQEAIESGHTYHVVVVVFDGYARTYKRCERCQAIHIHLRTKTDHYYDVWPDEQLSCGEEYEAHWGHEPPEDIAALAFVTAEEMQRRVA